MKRKNWYWDIHLPYKKIVQILVRENDPRFPRIAGALLSRVQDPKQVFDLISPKAFCRRYYAIQKEITSDEWTKEKAAFWKASYLRLSKELREQGERIREPGKMTLDDFDRSLIEKVKDCRKAALMSQKELAEFVGVSQQYISGIEKGREKISIDFFKKLSHVTHQRIDIVFE
jgi:DNA-binding XRE family transcriptional regulator